MYEELYFTKIFYYSRQVDKIRHSRSVKITLTVDLQNGKYSVLKPTGKENLGQNTISHDRSKCI